MKPKIDLEKVKRELLHCQNSKDSTTWSIDEIEHFNHALESLFPGKVGGKEYKSLCKELGY